MSTRSAGAALANAATAGALVLMVVASTPAPAQVCGPLWDGRVANVVYQQTTIVWEPVVEYEQMVLTIAGPCEDIVRVFRRGEPIVFDIREIERVQDGAYTWELRRAPTLDPATREELARARALDDDSVWWNLWQSGAIPQGPYVESAPFLVVNGVIVPPGQQEEKSGPLAKAETQARPVTSAALTPFSSVAAASKGPRPITAADQVIPDDLIVQGSICVGFDCVNGETFSFDTIRLKENNTRIKFDDTSTITGYPANDWQLTANDSASGGASKFSIEDITGSKTPFTIRAGAASNSIYVDSTGRVGFRTSTPILDLHVNTGNTPALRLQQNSSGGFTAQTWDIAGNEANFFVRDVTGGSKLPLRIRPGAPTSSVDISADGDTGVGTASPESKLHVFGSNTADVIVGIGPNPDGSPGTESALNLFYAGATIGRGAAILNVRPDSGATAPNPSLRFWTANVERLIIDNEGFIGLGVANPASPIQHSSGATLSATGQWNSVSSRKSKENIRELSATEALDTLHGLSPVKFDFKVAPGDTSVGFIAEDVPELVAEKSRANLNPMELIAVLTKVVQEQEKTIDELSAKVAELEKEK